MANDETSSVEREVRCANPQFALAVSRILPAEWQEAAVQTKYQAAAFAVALNLPPRQLLRECQRKFHCTVKTLLIDLQMLAALELLQETDRRKEVYDQLGFRYAAGFSRRFKAYFGVTPREFVRRKHHSVA